MESYKSFAQVYDMFMADVPYEDWADYIIKICGKKNLLPQLILELGCGTGSVSTVLAQNGYDVIGVDISEDMLNIAKEKAAQKNLDILYLNQDMRSFELYGTVDLVISLFDSMNYVLSEKDLLKVFKLVNNYLNPKGLFIFDLNTFYKFEKTLGNNIFADKKPEASYIWENYFNKRSGINEYLMTFFVKQPKGYYECFEETHYEKAYAIETVSELIKESGLKLLNIYGAYTYRKPKETDERIFFVAQEKEKRKWII